MLFLKRLSDAFEEEYEKTVAHYVKKGKTKAQAEKLADRREKIRAYGTDGRKHQKAVGKATDMVLQVFSQTYSECGREGNRRQTVGL
jgi:type I restriction-modification system DNA methylase subunit